jgi:predicted DNA-binding WGR domain protein
MKALKDYYGLETATSKVVWKQYITFREGSSNKFHFFVVFETAGKQYVAANAYGRIGYPAKIFDLGSFRDQYEALDVAKRKLHSKLNKGYEVTEID